MAAHNSTTTTIVVDPRSGFSKTNSTFYSKRKPIALPSNHSIDVTTFIFSRAHHSKTALIDAATDRRLTFPELWNAVESVDEIADSKPFLAFTVTDLLPKLADSNLPIILIGPDVNPAPKILKL